jgi:hypothetical protein
LTIPAGRKLGFAAGLDQGHNQTYGSDAFRSELIVRGQVDAQGNITTHVEIRSDQPAPAEADWFGVRFLGVTEQALSTLGYVDFKGARYALEMDSLSGNLIHPTFVASEKADIYIDQDLRIPPGYQVLLDAPTKVVVHDSDLGPSWATEEDALRVEIVAYDSFLEIFHPAGAAATDSVWFTSDAVSPASDDWFGIRWRDGAGQLNYVSIGHATDPVFFDGTFGAKLWNSNIYDFRDVALLDYLSDVSVKDSVIDGWPGGAQSGRMGIQLLGSTAGVEGTRIDWSGASGGNVYGINAQFTKSYCGSSLDPPGALTIQSNTLIGNGETASPATNTGLYLLWGCEHRHPRIERDSVLFWPKYGMHLQQCAETRVTCNQIIDNNTGVYYTRTSSAWGDSVRFSQNELKASNSENFFTDSAYRVLLRPDTQSATEGKNSIAEATAQGGKNVESTDSTVAIDALKNTWWKDGAITTVLSEIGSTITGNVSYDPPLASEQLCGAPGTLAGPGQAVASERPAAIRTPAEDPLPSEFALATMSPNPLRETTVIGYDVPAGYNGRISLTVYDVAGRKVRTLVEGIIPPGRHQATWAGVDEDGSRVASGVYFVHLRADDYRATRTVTLVK